MAHLHLYVQLSATLQLAVTHPPSVRHLRLYPAIFINGRLEFVVRHSIRGPHLYTNHTVPCAPQQDPKVGRRPPLHSNSSPSEPFSLMLTEDDLMPGGMTTRPAGDDGASLDLGGLTGEDLDAYLLNLEEGRLMVLDESEDDWDVSEEALLSRALVEPPRLVPEQACTYYKQLLQTLARTSPQLKLHPPAWFG